MAIKDRISGPKFIRDMAAVLNIDPSDVYKITIEAPFDAMVTVTVESIGTHKLKEYLLETMGIEKAPATAQRADSY